MTGDVERLRSVIAALKSVRKHVAGTYQYHWPPRIFNRWIDLLGNEHRRRARHLKLWFWVGVEHEAFKLHLDAAIAFLESELVAAQRAEPVGGSAAQDGADVLDAEFTEVRRQRKGKFWPPRLIKK